MRALPNSFDYVDRLILIKSILIMIFIVVFIIFHILIAVGAKVSRVEEGIKRIENNQWAEWMYREEGEKYYE